MVGKRHVLTQWRTGLLVALIVLVGALFTLGGRAAAESATAQFEDPALEWLVRQQIGVETGSIPLDAVQRIEELSLSYEVFSKDYTVDPQGVGRVKQLQGLEQLTGLKELRLWDFHEVDLEQLSQLAALPNLERLVIYGIVLNDLGAIGELEQLKELQLSLVSAQNLDALKGLTQLESLWLEYSEDVKDLSALGALGGLRELELISSSEKRSPSLASLSKLTDLRVLTLMGQRFEQVDFLSELTALNSLDLRGNPLSDYKILQVLPDLKRLILGRDVSSLEMLKPLAALEILMVENGQVSDLSPLSHLINLRELVLTNQQIVDLSPLRKLSKLEKLNLFENHVTSLEPLSALGNLQMLSAENNPITDAAAVSKLLDLRELYLRATNIRDITGWESLTKLEHIDLRQTVLDVDGDAKLSQWRKSLQDQGSTFEYDPYDPVPELVVFIHSKRVYAHGAYEELAEGSYIKDARTYVPLRFISEQLGAAVEWDHKARTISIKSEQTELLLTVGSTEVVQNNQKVTLDTAPEIRSGTTFVPLRFLSEQLGLTVDYYQMYPAAAIHASEM